MATAQQETTIREQLRTVLNELAQISSDSLARTELGSDLSF